MVSTEITILGEVWKICEGTADEFPALSDCDGYTDSSVRLIAIDDLTRSEDKADAKADLAAYKKQVLRHEIVHAFLEESGLSNNAHFSASWARDEEIVDWFAIQAPKIYKVFAELDILQ